MAANSGDSTGSPLSPSSSSPSDEEKGEEGEGSFDGRVVSFPVSRVRDLEGGCDHLFLRGLVPVERLLTELGAPANQFSISEIGIRLISFLFSPPRFRPSLCRRDEQIRDR